MKKRMMKCLCVLLCAVMTFSSASVAFAKENVTPIIFIHGLGGSDLYQHIGTDEQAKIPQYGLDVAAMLKNQDILTEALKLMDYERENDYDKLFKALGNYFADTNINCTESGAAQEGQGVLNYWTEPLSKHEDYLTLREFSIPVIARQVAKTVNPKYLYAFNYDWRLDVYDTAKGLHKTIQEVKKQTGAKKVTLVAMSLGGAVVSAYMDAYRNKKDVGRYVLINAAHQGLDVARAFEYDFSLDKDAVLSYLRHIEKAYQAGAATTQIRLVRAFGDVRIGTAINKLNEEVLKDKKLKKRFYLEVLKPWIGNMPSFWECIPYSEFDNAVKQMTKIGLLDKNSELYRRICRYHKIQGRFQKNLKAVKRGGAEVAIIANYGTRGLPVTSKRNNHTDLLIDTKYASVGAKVASYGKKLSRKGKYVSPDKVIDASTCALPNNTWFIKGLTHGLFHYDTEATKLLANLIDGKVKCNVKAVKKKYGINQFIKADAEQRLTNIK